MTTKETLKAMYDAFGTGNIPFILETISEDFKWTDPGNPNIIPFGGMYEGRSGLMDFFARMGGSIDTTHWQVDNYIGEGNTMAAEGKQAFTSKETGKNGLLEWSMIWNFENGVPVSGRSYYNTADAEKAFV